ncbi:MAG: OmpH family outer membrane protein [Bacteroidales bacterium]|nr:OmpH family outer membrane protein [Bacteroidales bacterium]
MEEINENIQEQKVQHGENFEFIAETPKEKNKSCTSTKGNCNMIHWIVEGVLLLAVIALFILHFAGNKCCQPADGEVAAVKVATKPGNGNILYVNLDTIYECKLFEEKQAVLDEESKKLENTFTARQKKLEADYTQFQKNMNAGVLNETQMQYTYQQLETESNKIREDYQTAMENLAQKQADLTNEMLDALREAADLVNASVEGDPASYVVTYSSSNPTVIVVDPSRDITAQVVRELNKKCAKKSDK